MNKDKFVILRTDDYIGVYRNGILIADGHSIYEDDLIEALFPEAEVEKLHEENGDFDFESLWVSGEGFVKELPENYKNE